MLDAQIEDFKDLAKKHGLTIDQVVQIKTVLEMERKTTYLSYDGDYWDEQMGGFGDRLNRLCDSLEMIADSISSLKPKKLP